MANPPVFTVSFWFSIYVFSLVHWTNMPALHKIETCLRYLWTTWQLSANSWRTMRQQREQVSLWDQSCFSQTSIMTNATIEIIRAGLKSDSTVTPEQRTRLIAILRSPIVPAHTPLVTSAPKLIKRAEAARRLSCSTRTVDKLASSEVLRKCKLPGRVRAAGFLETDVDALIQN